MSRKSVANTVAQTLRQFQTIRTGFDGCVGVTPLVELRGPSEEAGCRIVAKAEMLNAGGSVKDRAALYLIKDAEEKGLLLPGGTVVEGTAGNTGIGLAHVCNARGYKCVIFMPNTQSAEKVAALRILGAQVHTVPAVPFANEQNYNHQARRWADEHDNAVWTNQFDNTANRLAHYATTGPELWAQTDGAVTAFTCATGTGGTLHGTAQYLKEVSDGRVRTVLADPPGSVLYEWVTRGELVRTGDGSVTEGIGQGRVTDNLRGAPIDDAVHIPDSESVATAFRLLHRDGFFVGLSSALNVAAAIRVGRTLNHRSAIVATILCDSGTRYASKMCSKGWLEKNDLLKAVPEEYHSSIPFE